MRYHMLKTTDDFETDFLWFYSIKFLKIFCVWVGYLKRSSSKNYGGTTCFYSTVAALKETLLKIFALLTGLITNTI